MNVFAAGEPSARLAFAGNRIARDSEHRTEESLPAALADPRARLLAIGGGRLLMAETPDGFRPYLTAAEAAGLAPTPEEAVLLGHDADGPVLALPVAFDPDRLPPCMQAIDHRSIYVQGLLGPAELGALAQGAALLTWHRNHRYCSRCGQPTASAGGGCKRVCTGCSAEHFPRTDPVVIMLATRDETCLLGRSPHFAPGMVSALAGFVEPGETIEAAVRRETFEEAAIRLGRVTYHASQPWPFPHSLMIGCHAEALDAEIRFDGTELEDCRWFTREAVLAMLAGTHPDGWRLPPPGAIANELIRHWAERPRG